MFKNRVDAGIRLAKSLGKYRKAAGCLVVGLARGGVVVADQVAKKLELPLTVLVVRKVGAPHQQELALGAVTSSGESVFNEELIRDLGVSKDYILAESGRQRQIAKQREVLYGGQQTLKGKTILLVDDGIATGASIRLAIQSLRTQKVKTIVLAVPVAPPESLQRLAKEVEEVVCLDTPLNFFAVGAFYESFEEVTDSNLIQLFELL